MKRILVILAGLVTAFVVPWIVPPILLGVSGASFWEIPTAWANHFADLSRGLSFLEMSILALILVGGVSWWVRSQTIKTFLSLSVAVFLVSPFGIFVLAGISYAIL